MLLLIDRLSYRYCFSYVCIFFQIDIIERVRNRENPPFRPTVCELIDKAEGLRDLMKNCWMENPDERPTFQAIRKNIEVMMKDNKM